jgi:hypothetical protein
VLGHSRMLPVVADALGQNFCKAGHSLTHIEYQGLRVEGDRLPITHPINWPLHAVH